MKEIDRLALERALVACRRESVGRAKQIDAMLADPSRSWERVARFAAYSCQIDALHLMPWETAPIRITNIAVALNAPDDARRVGDAARLLQRMLAAGLSRYEANPLEALERVA